MITRGLFEFTMKDLGHMVKAPWSNHSKKTISVAKTRSKIAEKEISQANKWRK